MEQPEEELEYLGPSNRDFYFVREHDTDSLEGGKGPEHPDYITDSSRITFGPDRRKPEQAGYESSEQEEVVKRRMPETVEEAGKGDILVRSYGLPAESRPEPESGVNPVSQMLDIEDALETAYRWISNNTNSFKEHWGEDGERGYLVAKKLNNIINYSFSNRKRGEIPSFRLQAVTSSDYTQQSDTIFGEPYSAGRDTPNQKSLFQDTSEDLSSPQTAFDKFFQELIEETGLGVMEEVLEGHEGHQVSNTAREGVIIGEKGDTNIKRVTYDSWVHDIPRMMRNGIIIY